MSCALEMRFSSYLTFPNKDDSIKLQSLAHFRRNKMNQESREEPRETETIINRKRVVVAAAGEKGHAIGNWKWRGMANYWLSFCQHPGCSAIAYLYPNGECKGSAIT